MPGKKTNTNQDNTRVTPTSYERRPGGDDNGDVSVTPTPVISTTSGGNKTKTPSKKNPS